MDVNGAAGQGLPMVKQGHRKMHRRSAAVSLDWGFTQMLNRPDGMNAFDESEIKGQTKLESKKRMQETDKHVGKESENNSGKKPSKFRIWFWIETISSLIHLYFGNLSKKMSSKVETSTVDKNEPLPPISSCTMIWEPLIDLDAALLTKTGEQTTSGMSKRHLRARCASLTLPISVCDSEGFYRKSLYKRGSSFRRKMSVIVEDMDTTLPQLPVTFSLNHERKAEDNGETLPLSEDKENMIKTLASDKTNDSCSGLKDESDYNLCLLDNPSDLINMEAIKAAEKSGKGSVVLNQRDSVEKKQKVKRRWHHAIKGFFIKKKN